MATLYARLREDILSGALAPGAQLVELVVAERYGVSRTPVREALQRLHHDGLVERRAAVMVVRERSPEEILEIYEARIALEGAAAAAAARRRTDLDLAKIRNAGEQMAAGSSGSGSAGERADGSGDEAAMVLNRAYHTAIWSAAHNATLVDLLTRIEAQLSRYSGTTLRHPGRWETAVTEHEAITAAIEAQDAAEAERLAREHLDHARVIRLAMFADLEAGR